MLPRIWSYALSRKEAAKSGIGRYTIRGRFKMTHGVLAGLMVTLFALSSAVALAAQGYELSGLNMPHGSDEKALCFASFGSSSNA